MTQGGGVTGVIDVSDGSTPEEPLVVLKGAPVTQSRRPGKFCDFWVGRVHRF